MAGETLPSVSACLIVRDEALRLPECLASLSGHVDEIVVVDTGSTDDTVAIAERFGSRISHRPWDNDFSAARNFGLDQARGDWILYIDADERLSCPGGSTLKQLVAAGPPSAGFQVRFHSRSQMTGYAEYRVFRNDPRIRFVGSMHESILPGLRQVCADEDVGISPLYDAVITHVGYEGDLTRKYERNLPLLERAIVDYPTRVYLRYDLGVCLNGLGRTAESRVRLAEGIALAELPGVSRQARVEGSSCARLLASLQLDDGDVSVAVETVQRGLALYPDNLTLHWTKARCLLALGKAQDAIGILQRHLDHDPETFFDPAISYGKSLFGEDRLSLLGSARFRLGDYGEAARCFEAAAACTDDPLEYRAKAALARARASHVVEDAGHRL